jgi:hypothetical protein
VKIAKGWRRISHKRGFVNDETGQTLLIAKKTFGEHYHVLLFKQKKTLETESSTISPEFSSETKAETFAICWMNKNPNGTTQ